MPSSEYHGPEAHGQMVSRTWTLGRSALLCANAGPIAFVALAFVPLAGGIAELALTGLSLVAVILAVAALFRAHGDSRQRVMAVLALILGTPILGFADLMANGQPS